jgi:acetolactate synthase-1/2/3 large subunit
MGLAAAYRHSRPVIGICGDGGLLMVGNELATCVRHDIPVVLAVFDNGGLGMIDHGMQTTFGRSRFAGVPDVDLVGYVESLGAEIRTIASAGDLTDAVRRRGPGPLVLHFRIDPNVTAGNPRVHGFVATRNEHV